MDETAYVAFFDWRHISIAYLLNWRTHVKLFKPFSNTATPIKKKKKKNTPKPDLTPIPAYHPDQIPSGLNPPVQSIRQRTEALKARRRNHKTGPTEKEAKTIKRNKPVTTHVTSLHPLITQTIATFELSERTGPHRVIRPCSLRPLYPTFCFESVPPRGEGGSRGVVTLLHH